MPNARSPLSPATSTAQYPAGSGVGVSVFLGQPGGFEGLLAIVEHLHLSDLASGEPPDREVGALHRHAAATSNLALADDRQNPVASVDQLLDFEVDLAKGGEEFAPALPHTLVSSVDRLEPHSLAAPVRDIPDDVLGVDLERGHDVTPGDRVVDPLHDLHVLL